MMFVLALVGVVITVAARSTLGSQYGSFLMSISLGLMLGPLAVRHTSASPVFILAVTPAINLFFGVICGWTVHDTNQTRDLAYTARNASDVAPASI